MARVEALVEPALLIWARETAGYTVSEAAEKIGVPAARVSGWEAGETRPTVAQLREIARVYKRPLPLFYLAEPPRNFQPVADYRRIASTPGARISPELRFEIRRAHALREDAIELAALLEENLASLPKLLPPPTDPEDIARRARAFLGVNIEQQAGWSKPDQARRGWTAAVEAKGVLVAHASGIPLQEMRGLSLSYEQAPVIMLNSADSDRGRIFTLLHEFAHLLLRTSGLCDLHEAGLRPADLEVQCNAAAAAMLMPRGVFASQSEVRGAPPGYEGWSPEVLRTLGRRFTASEEAVLRRLLVLGKTSLEFYQRRREELQEEWKRSRADRDSPIVPQHYRVLSSVGEQFARLAFRAYESERINLHDLTSYLGMKVRHVQPLRIVLEGREGRSA